MIYHFEFPKLGEGLSGGEKCLVELARHFAARQIPNTILTTDNGRSTYERLGLAEGPYLQYRTVQSYGGERRWPVFVSYVLRTLQAVRLVRDLDVRPNDILICNSEFFPNSIPFFVLARRVPRARRVYWFRMLAPDLFRGFDGQFTGRIRMPGPRLVNYRLNQWLYRRLAISPGIILTVNPWYRDKLAAMFPDHDVHAVSRYSGVTIPGTNPGPKQFDLVWMGRFHRQKGLDQLVDVFTRIIRERPGSTLLIVGGGEPRAEARLRADIERHGLRESVHFAGMVTDDREKFCLLQQSRVFLMPSLYESFGQVNIEAMKCGLPVVGYDLPVYEPFRDGMVTVPVLDNARFAGEALAMLRSDAQCRQMSDRALEVGSTFSWEATCREIEGVIGAEV
jgi:glycosyltransferase involved in cell wall biosynthesis